MDDLRPGTADTWFASQERPFIGLRPFVFEDAAFYFGREEHIDRLIELLLRGRMISVVGSSGSGKSSLVLAGLLPRIMSGEAPFLDTWDRIETRPGESPIRNLAEALANPNHTAGIAADDDMAGARADRMELILLGSSFGIRDALGELYAPQRRHAAIIIDQFEEIFRFADLRERRTIDPQRAAEQRDEETQFIQLLLTAASDSEFDGCIIITMRSDFIGECARFEGLSEAVTKSQYLVPALTRDQRGRSIRRPVMKAGGTIEALLVQQLLNETSEDMDQLPILQHAMMRCWQHALARRPGVPHLTLDDYAAIGGISGAIAQHADQLLEELARDHQGHPAGLAPDLVACRIFQCLTDQDSRGRTIRRPQTLGAMAGVLLADDASDAEAAEANNAVREVIAHFSNPDCSFLRVPSREGLSEDSVVDIGHEALIRRWERLGGEEPESWVKKEQHDADQYRSLVQLAVVGSLVEEERLPAYEAWWQERRPNRCWAGRYSRGGVDRLDDARAVLVRSRERILRQQQAAERAKRVRRRWIGSAIAVGVAVLILISYLREREAQEKAQDALKAQAHLTAMLGNKELTLGNPHLGLQKAIGDLHAFAVAQADIPDLYDLAYAAMQSLWETQILRVSHGFLPLAFDPKGNLVIFDQHEIKFLPLSDVDNPRNDERFQILATQIQFSYGNVDVSSDGTIMISGSAGTYLSDPKNPTSGHELLTDGDSVGTGAISKDGTLILTMKRGKPAKLWKRDASLPAQASDSTLQIFPEETDDLAGAISADNRYLAFARSSGEITIYERGNGSAYDRLHASPDTKGAGNATMLAFDPADSGVLLAVYPQASPRLYLLRDGVTRVLQGGDGAFRSAFSPDGSLIAAPSVGRRAIDVWLTPLVEKGDVGPFTTLPTGQTFAPISIDSHYRVAAATLDGTIWIWDLNGSIASRGLSTDAPPNQQISVTLVPGIGPGEYRMESSGVNLPDYVLHLPEEGPTSPAQETGKAAQTPQQVSKGTLSPDHRWLAVYRDTGPILLFDLTRDDSQAVAVFGGGSMKLDGPPLFADDPRRIIARLSNGPPIAWRYFQTADELVSFAWAQLPKEISLVDDKTQGCTAQPVSSLSEEDMLSQVIAELTERYPDTTCASQK